MENFVIFVFKRAPMSNDETILGLYSNVRLAEKRLKTIAQNILSILESALDLRRG